MTKLIQSGPRNAKIVIVGESPGTTELATGMPFSGASGELLNRMLSTVGLSRSEIFVTNICHVQPPKNEFSWFLKPKPRPELILGLVQLRKDLVEIKPNLVIALGAYPLQYLTNKVGISKWRGSILTSTLVSGLKIIGSYHPAAILRIWDYKAVSDFDFKRMAEEAKTPEVILPQREFKLNPSREDSILIRDRLLRAEWLSVDIECVETPTGWKLSCVGFSDSPGFAAVWPVDEPWKLQLIKELCESPMKKVFQNGTFDVTVLAENGITVSYESFQWDTMLGHHSLFTECAGGGDEMSELGGKKKQAALAKGLGFQTSIYTREPYYKDDGKLWRETEDKEMFWRYNALDAACTHEIRGVQEKELKDFDTLDVLKYEMSLVEPLHKMMQRGVLIDMNLRTSLKADFEKQINNLQTFLDKSAGQSVNVKSPKQMLELLYNKLNLPQKYNHKTHKPTANKDAIIELGEKYNHPILQTILAIRQRRDFIERYLDAKIDADGRMRCAYDITGTRTGRLSSRQSIYGSGTNLQNIPSRRPEGEAIRRMFLADPNKVLVGRDYKQAEAWIVAYRSNSERLIELFNDPSRDVHYENASRIFSKPISEITYEERYLAKKVIHASNYGMGPDRLVQVVNEDAPFTGIRITRTMAVQLIEKYFLLFPEIKEIYWKAVERELRYSRTLTNMFGRKRMFFGRWDDKLLRDGYAYDPQSTVGDLMNKGLVNCYHQIEKVIPGAELLLQVHDSATMQCYEADAERVSKMMEQAMTIPLTYNDNTFIIPSDCKIGYNWGKKAEDNPRGMIDLEQWFKEAA